MIRRTWARVALVLLTFSLPGAARAEDGPHCPPGQAPSFKLGFAALQAQLGQLMGEPLTCAFPDSKGTGDVLQQTTTGLAFWRKATNTATFTNGWEHWGLTPEGLVTWVGASIDPPVPGEPTVGEPPPASAPDPQGRTHIPAWLQTLWRVPLYTEPEVRSPIAGTVPQYTFLRVLRAGEYLLQVEAVGEGGQAGAIGWVQPPDVQPSEPGEGWLRNEGAIPLFLGSEAHAGVVGELAPGAALRQVDQPVGQRLPVRVYAENFSAVLVIGWVEAAAVHAVPPPRASVLLMRDEPPPPNPFADRPEALIEAVAAVARELAPASGIPVSVTVAQAIIESAWGDSVLARVATNYLGVKAIGRLGNDGVVWFTTQEYDEQGNRYETIAPFRAYKRLADSVTDHHRLLLERPEYRAAMEVTGDAREFARRVQQGGYSTDPAYAEKLIQLMDQHELYRLDA